jgi:hypothetical protein
VAIVSEDQIGKMLLTVSLCNPQFPEKRSLDLDVCKRADNNIKKKQSQDENVPLASLTTWLLVWAVLAPVHTEETLEPLKVTPQPSALVEEDMLPLCTPPSPPPLFNEMEKTKQNKLQCLENA